MEETHEVANYFRKILKLELGINVAERKHEAEGPKTLDVDIQSGELEKSMEVTETRGSIERELTPPTPIVTEREISSHSIMDEIIKSLEELRSTLLNRIEALERRVNKLEGLIQKVFQGVKALPMRPEEAPKYADTPRYFSLSSISVDDIDLLMHEANELLAKRENSLPYLIKLEAIEWRLIKALENNEIAKNKVSLDFLKALRVEINRLRKALLK